jgi:hypothetical protein
MAQSQLALYNLAIATTGTNYRLTATSEESEPAELCELFFENVRQTLLRAAHWRCAKRFARLTEEAERDTAASWVSTDPEPGFLFSYEIPDSMLAARYLSDFSQFELGYETDQKIISCDIGGADTDDAPVLCYTIDVTDVTLYDPDLYMAMYYALGAHLSMPLTGKPARAQSLFGLANQQILEARAATANEMHRLFKERSLRMQARDAAVMVQTPYIYPYGNMFSGTGAPVV